MTTLASLTAQAFTAGGGSLGPWANPGGNGVRITIDRTALIAGSLLGAVLRYSFDGGSTWVQQGTLVLVGGVIPQAVTSLETPWGRRADGSQVIPTHIKFDLLISQSFTAAAVLVETM